MNLQTIRTVCEKLNVSESAVRRAVEDIRVEMRTMRNKLDDHSERLVKVESRAASNTHRLDALEKWKQHPPDSRT